MSGQPGSPFGLARRSRRIVIPLALSVALSTTAHAQTSRQKAERLATIAVATEWVATNCGTAGLDGMLLLTMRSAIRQIDAEDLARLRASFARSAQEFPTKTRACEVWRRRLVEIQ